MSKASAMAAEVQLEVVDPTPTMALDCTDGDTAEIVVALEVKVAVTMETVVVVGVVVEIFSAVNDDDIGTLNVTRHRHNNIILTAWFRPFFSPRVAT